MKHVVYRSLLFLCPSRWELALQHPQSAKDDKIRAYITPLVLSKSGHVDFQVISYCPDLVQKYAAKIARCLGVRSK